ncbi:MAG: hypothetical protein ACYC7E_11765 [Armatimonadota bacterium]
MHKQFVLGIVCMGMLAVLSVAGWALPDILVAQNTTGETGAATSTTTAATPETTPYMPTFVIGLGYLGLEIDGNARRYQQYVTPPEGGFVGQAEFYQSQATGDIIDLGVRDIDQPSFAGDLWAILGAGQGVLAGQYRQSRFFRNWDIGDESLERRDQAYEVLAQFGLGTLGLQYDDVTLAGQASTDPEDWVRSQGAASLTSVLRNNWVTQIGVRDENLAFHTADAPFNVSTEGANARLVSPVSERSAFEFNASVNRADVDDPIATSPKRLVLGLEGTQLLGDSMTLSGEFAYNRLADAIAENAYTRGDMGGELRLRFDGLPRTYVEVGGGSRQVSYVNAIQTLVHQVPANDLFARVSTRISDRLRLKAYASTWWSTDRPVAFDSLGDPETFSLVWSRKNDQRIEATYNLSPLSALTARWRRQDWSNADLAVKNSLTETDLFGWWMPTEKVTLYASLMQQVFGLPAVVGTTYRTSSNTGVVGATFQLAPRVSLDLAYTQSASRGAELADQQIVTLGLDYLLRNGGKFSILASYDDYENPVVLTPDLNYTGKWVEVRYTFAAF